MDKTIDQREGDTLFYIQGVCGIDVKNRIANELRTRQDRTGILKGIALGTRRDFIGKALGTREAQATTNLRHAVRSVLLLRALHEGLYGAQMDAAKPTLLSQTVPVLNGQIKTLAEQVALGEDEFGRVLAAGKLVFVGVSSCYTVTCITAGSIVGLHVVQISAGGGTFYYQRMPALLQQLPPLLAGNPLQRLFLIAPEDMYPLLNQQNSPEQLVYDALFPASPAPHAPPAALPVHHLDISNLTARQAAYILFDKFGGMLTVFAQGAQVYQVPFAAAPARHAL